MKKLYPFLAITILFSVLIGRFTFYVQEVRAQEINQWATPLKIPGLTDQVLTPYLLADGNKTVHAFASDWVGGNEPQKAVMYLQWIMQSGWTNPIDIILPQSGDARIKGAFLDDNGIIHLTYFEGDDISAQIKYSNAYASQAGNALAWSDPKEVGPLALTPDGAVLAGNNQGTLVIAYLGNVNERGLYSTYSLDGGETWSEAAPIYFVLSEDEWPSALEHFVDQQDRMHLVWTVRSPTSESVELVYYARLDMDNFQWSEPTILSELEPGHLAWSVSIIEYRGELFAIFHDDNPTTRWMRRSRDGGDSWSEPIRLFDHIGSNGAASLVIDGNGIMHMFFGNRIGWPSIHGLWHSTWANSRWSPPLPVVSGPRIVDKFGQSGFDPSFARAVVSQGNTILVAWTTDPGAGLNGVWYSYVSVDALEEMISPLPLPPGESFLPVPTATVDPTSVPRTPLPRELLVQDQAAGAVDSIASTGNTIIWVTSIFPVLLFVFAAVYYYRVKK
jgi:hypothetical protein